MSTVVAQTLSNGSVSTSTANCITGSAKAWVKFFGGNTGTGGGTAGVINGSYNVSSITVNTTGDFTVNYTNALGTTSYVVVTTTTTATQDSGSGETRTALVGRTDSASTRVFAVNSNNGSLLTCRFQCVACFA